LKAIGTGAEAARQLWRDALDVFLAMSHDEADQDVVTPGFG
jgi:hypothetical protein